MYSIVISQLSTDQRKDHSRQPKQNYVHGSHTLEITALKAKDHVAVFQ